MSIEWVWDSRNEKNTKNDEFLVSLEMQNSQKTRKFAFCLKSKTLKKQWILRFAWNGKFLPEKMPPKKNNRGRVGAAHFVVAFLKSYPKPKAGPYDIRTIVFERQTFRSTKSQHETLLRCVIESDGGTKHLLQNHNHGKPHATCRNAASPQLRFEKDVVFLDHVLCSSCFFHVHHVSIVQVHVLFLLLRASAKLWGNNEWNDGNKWARVSATNPNRWRMRPKSSRLHG